MQQYIGKWDMMPYILSDLFTVAEEVGPEI
jgi:hypothetical protein